VKATNEATGLSYSTTSSTAGEFAFSDLPLGDYTMVVSLGGFETFRISRVRVSAGAIYNVPVRLRVAELSASVEVSAAAVSVETTSTTLTSVLSTRTVQDLPLNGRDFSQMLALTPGFSGYEGGGSASMNGSRSNQFNWQSEGTDNNDQWFNIKAVNQGGINSIPGVLLPLDSLEEYSVQTQAAAETGRNPGGAVNLIIKSGTNRLHGSAYYYNRNEALSALSPFAPVGSPKNKLRNEHYGFSFGGPIQKDRTFFFTTYEDQNFEIGNQALATMPSSSYQAAALQLLKQYSIPVNPVSQTLLNNLWPADTLSGAAASNNYFNPTPQTGYSHNFLVKLDHSLNDDHRLSFRGQQQSARGLRQCRLRYPPPLRRLRHLRHPRIVARPEVAVPWLAVEQQPLCSHRFSVHRPCLVRHERYRRKHDSRRRHHRRFEGFSRHRSRRTVQCAGGTEVPLLMHR
jgi:hypothetical protein